MILCLAGCLYYGIGPERLLMFENLNLDKRLSLANDIGIWPDNLLSDSSRSSKFMSLDILSWIWPEKLLSLRSNT